MAREGGARVAVVGAAGFLGQQLLQTLMSSGVRATAAVRGAAEVAGDTGFHTIVSPSDAVARGPYDVVVNLAYPSGGPPFEDPTRDREIVHLVDELVRDGGHLIHASTLAVFGLALDHPALQAPVPRRRDEAYIESKIDAEHLVAEMGRRRSLRIDVVRFGNIWGRGSASWAVPLVQRLVTGRPVAVSGCPNMSNATDVANAAAYLALLVTSAKGPPGISFQHVAEFSDTSWLDFIRPLAAALGAEPVYADRAALTVRSPRAELASVFAPVSPRATYQRLAFERTMGSVTRSALRRLPGRARAKLRSDGLVVAPRPQYSFLDSKFLAVVAGEREFRSTHLGEWEPPVTKEESIQRVLEWLDPG